MPTDVCLVALNTDILVSIQALQRILNAFTYLLQPLTARSPHPPTPPHWEPLRCVYEAQISHGADRWNELPGFSKQVSVHDKTLTPANELRDWSVFLSAVISNVCLTPGQMLEEFQPLCDDGFARGLLSIRGPL